MKLSSLKTGQAGYVTEVSGRSEFRRRIFDMGVTYGARITVKKSAPFGDPVEIEVRGYRLSLRKCDAENINVERVEV